MVLKLDRELQKLVEKGKIHSASVNAIKNLFERYQNIINIPDVNNLYFDKAINKQSDRENVSLNFLNEIQKQKKRISLPAIERLFNNIVEKKRKQAFHVELNEARRDKELNLQALYPIRQNIERFNKKSIHSFDIENNQNIPLEDIFNLLRLMKDNFIITIIFLNDKNEPEEINYLIKEGIVDKLINILDSVRNRYLQPVELFGSDQEMVYNMNIAKSFSIERYIPKYEDEKRTYTRQTGAFFKWFHKLDDIDLSRYQIYTAITHDDAINENCLIYALHVGGMKPQKLNQLKLMVVNNNLPICKLKEVCEKLDITIELKKDGYKNLIKYGQGEEKYKIGLIAEHYFLIEQVKYTSYSIKNYFTVHDKKDFNRIINITPNQIKRENRFISSFDLIKILVDNKESHLKEIIRNDISDTTQYKRVIENYDDLKYSSECVRKFEKKDKDDESDYVNIFFDFETYTEKETLNHIPYLCCYEADDGTVRGFIGAECGFSMLCDLYKRYKKVRMIAHNCSYDFTFLIQYLYNIESIEDGKNLYRADASFKLYKNKPELKLIFKDSYKLISSPLKKFPKMFFPSEKIKKEVMPYSFYTAENLDARFCKISEALKHVNKGDEEDFLENIEEWKIKKADTFDIIEYSINYCFIDCKVLRKGYNVFKGWINEHFNIDIDSVISSASLADLYLYNEGVYDGIYELSGLPQNFIQGCVVGGRCMTRANKKWHIKSILNDFDAVSLYPSAMYRLNGFLKGVPKVIEKNQLNDRFLKTVDGYFIDIKILEVEKERDFPLLNYKNSEGIRDFTNDMEGEIIRVDNITLEDLQEFQKIKYEVIRGYYFNNGFNSKINSVIESVFKKRLELKALDNPAQEIYKLILNSAYGKTIMKEKTDENIWFNNEDKAMESILLNYHSYISHYKKGERVRVTNIKPVNTHFNRCHIGSSILSMSKRIMNEVITLAEDNNIKIYYQDTDSMHIVDNKVEKLSELFKEKYNRELIGKNLGQFHCDFEMEGCKNIVSVESYFLGKKIYIDYLRGEDETGYKYSHHIRMKGVPSSCIKYTCEQMNINPPELYQKLMAGDKIAFDLLEGGNKTMFQHNKGQYRMMKEFIREIKV